MKDHQNTPKIFLGFLFIFFFQTVSAQNYTWVRGSTVSGLAGIYGTMGIPAPGNNPGGRHGSAKWVDAAGNLWLFGGEGYSSVNTLCWLNDLWKYDITTNQWTWIRGSNIANQSGVYGTQGLPAATNEPGAREFSASWVDNQGNFWMFGGDGYSNTSTFGRLSDLWKYDPTTNQWTWMKGTTTLNQNGNYGTQALPAASNNPGARFGSGTWVDAGGDLWMFGGRGYPATGPSSAFLNDLWRFNIAGNNWTWVNGSTIIGQAGVFGTINVPSPLNYPGAKEFPACWQDATGNLYLFGGRGAGYFNDFWRYNIQGNTWTWIGGANIPNQNGVYGTMGVPGPAVMPGGRFASSHWQDKNGNFWLSEGTGWSATTLNMLNDLFRYDPCSSQWTWMKGSDTTNQSGIYGTQGIPAPSNNPGGRMYSNFWTGKQGMFWLFGGEGFDASSISIGHMNDLWKYDPNFAGDSITSVPAASLCSGSTTTLLVSNSFSNIVWYQNPTSTVSVGNGSTYVTIPLTAASAPTLYTFYAQASCLLKPRILVTLTVNPLPNIVISGTNAACAGSSITLSASGANSYTWNTTATTPTISVVPTGSLYTVIVIGTSTAGCENSANTSVTVHAVPTLSVVATKTFLCKYMPDQTTLTAFGANTYSWTNGPQSSVYVYTSSISSGYSTSTFVVSGLDANGCVGSGSIVIPSRICEGVSENNFGIPLKLYPSPSTGEFVIEYLASNNDVIRFVLYNQLGQLVYEAVLIEKRNVVNTTLSSGVYYYRVEQKDKSAIGKLVIDR